MAAAPLSQLGATVQPGSTTAVVQYGVTGLDRDDVCQAKLSTQPSAPEDTDLAYLAIEESLSGLSVRTSWFQTLEADTEYFLRVTCINSGDFTLAFTTLSSLGGGTVVHSVVAAPSARG